MLTTFRPSLSFCFKPKDPRWGGRPLSPWAGILRRCAPQDDERRLDVGSRYSLWSEMTGFTRAARTAGINVATDATTSTARAIAPPTIA